MISKTKLQIVNRLFEFHKYSEQHHIIYKSIIKEYLNVYVITGYGLMVLSTVLVVLGLKGVPYKNEPIIESLGYLFVMILSNRLLGEKITKKKVLGNVLILVGIAVYYI